MAKALTSETMLAVCFDGERLQVRSVPRPHRQPGWAVVRMHLAGICRTDLEILGGYLGFRGILGHEFVGTVVDTDEPDLVGRRVVGDINAACGACAVCRNGLGRHCPSRVTLGIDQLDGCMAEFCTLPAQNLHPVPDEIPNRRAVFAEPLAAACEILEQVPLTGRERVLVLGDGRLGALCAWVLALRVNHVTVLGRHPEKLTRLQWCGIQTAVIGQENIGEADLVVEVTGTGSALEDAMRLCRPRGAIVLKTTRVDPTPLNLTPAVIREQTIIGSRCGQIPDALRFLSDNRDVPLERLLTATYPLAQAEHAFNHARRPDALKILLRTTHPA